MLPPTSLLSFHSLNGRLQHRLTRAVQQGEQDVQYRSNMFTVLLYDPVVDSFTVRSAQHHCPYEVFCFLHTVCFTFYNIMTTSVSSGLLRNAKLVWAEYSHRKDPITQEDVHTHWAEVHGSGLDQLKSRLTRRKSIV